MYFSCYSFFVQLISALLFSSGSSQTNQLGPCLGVFFVNIPKVGKAGHIFSYSISLMLLFHKLFISREINTNAPFQKSEEILFSEFYKDLFFFYLLPPLFPIHSFSYLLSKHFLLIMLSLITPSHKGW